MRLILNLLNLPFKEEELPTNKELLLGGSAFAAAFLTIIILPALLLK